MAAMEFWASEVKSGESLKVQPDDGMLLHLSQASLGESKKDKGNESVTLFVNVDGKKLVLGSLSSEKIPQQQFDLVFPQEFELSHNWKSGSVYFFGYKADNGTDEEEVRPDFDLDTDSSDEDIIDHIAKPVVKAKKEKTTDAKKSENEKDSAPKKGKSEKVTPVKSEDDDSDDSMSDDDDENTNSDEEDDESGSDDEDGSEEETPVKVETVETGKKRASESEPKTPAANKKVKLATPQKTDGKTGGSTHVATPHPSKQTEKKPKSAGGSHACKSCSRTFGSEAGLESHTKAKHSAGK